MKYDFKDFWRIKAASDFEDAALQVFDFQARHNPIYANFLHHLGFSKTQFAKINQTEQIPFLPVSFFKEQSILSSDQAAPSIAYTFSSSGTTGMTPSLHQVLEISLYEQSFLKGFEHFYGPAEEFCFLALLPSYLERSGSSLIYMTEALIQKSRYKQSGFFLHNLSDLRTQLTNNKSQHIPTILLGVTYALLDFVELAPIDFPELIVMETGGMKGQRKEMIREELHAVLKAGFGVKQIHSEYGMTELLSQAYAKQDGLFQCPPWMQVRIRETNDPFSYVNTQQSGAINIIDLANVYSCAFIATQDLGKQYADGSFEVLGRFDHADLRGCNLLVQ